MEDELTIEELDEIIDALNRKNQAIEDQPISSIPGDAQSHSEAYLARCERRDRVEEILRKVRILKKELTALQG